METEILQRLIDDGYIFGINSLPTEYGGGVKGYIEQDLKMHSDYFYSIWDAIKFIAEKTTELFPGSEFAKWWNECQKEIYFIPEMDEEKLNLFRNQKLSECKNEWRSTEINNEEKN